MSRAAEIRALLRGGRRVRTRHFDAYFRESPVGRPRVGLVVPRYQFRLVDRNRVKRRLREALRLEWLPRCHADGALDLLLRVHREAYGASYQALAETVGRLAESLCSHES